jgi:hypothetical protein
MTCTGQLCVVAGEKGQVMQQSNCQRCSCCSGAPRGGVCSMCGVAVSLDLSLDGCLVSVCCSGVAVEGADSVPPAGFGIGACTVAQIV